MIKHIVFWRFKEEAGGKSKLENLVKAKDLFEGLRGTIKEIGALEVGVNFDRTDDASDFVLYSEFSTIDGLRAYQRHPEHVKVVEFLAKVKSEKRVVDFES